MLKLNLESVFYGDLVYKLNTIVEKLKHPD